MTVRAVPTVARTPLVSGLFGPHFILGVSPVTQTLIRNFYYYFIYVFYVVYAKYRANSDIGAMFFELCRPYYNNSQNRVYGMVSRQNNMYL